MKNGQDIRIERLTLRLGGVGTGGAARLGRLVAEGLAEADVEWPGGRGRALPLELKAPATEEPQRLAARVVALILAEVAREAP